MFENIKVYAFVGQSGTGKSYRAQMVASKFNIDYIIDDGILVEDNEIVAGNSAKKAPTKIETVKRALFIDNSQKKEMQRAIRKHKPKSILILGTSDSMVEEIAKNLDLPPITKTIYITEVATEEEINSAKRIRSIEGKHVIPVPTFEIKKDFSGYLLDPLQIFKTNGLGNKPYISEKSIIRPTFNYIGNFTISDTVFRQIVDYLAEKNDAITEILRVRVNNSEEGPTIYIEAEVKYGINILSALNDFKEKCIKEIERLTSMNVKSIRIIAKKITLPKIFDINF